jgi:hypothetical protein
MDIFIQLDYGDYIKVYYEAEIWEW